jgi:RecB family exonuclease
MLDYSETTLKYAPWSMSKANLAKNCPLAFDHKYVRKAKGTTPAKSPAARIGTAVHQILELYLQDMDIKVAVQRALIDNKLTTDEKDDVASYVHNIISFKKRLSEFKERHSITETHVEVRFGMTDDLQPTEFFGKDVFMRGVWDIAMRAGNHAVIVDHKSGLCPSSPEAAFEKHSDQMKLYSIASLHRFPGIEGAQTAFHYVMSEEIFFAKTVTASQIQNSYVPWYVRYLNDCSRDITTKEARTGWLCNFCEFTHLCPKKRNP